MIKAKGSSFSGASDGTSDLFADTASNTFEVHAADATVTLKNGVLIISKTSAAAITLTVHDSLCSCADLCKRVYARSVNSDIGSDGGNRP